MGHILKCRRRKERLTRRIKVLLLICLGIGCYTRSYAQTCTDIGQNPQSAFPVCGTSSFEQQKVKFCGNRRVPGPCDKDEVSDKNPFWYKFTCFEAGKLGLLITPKDLGDDYDWQLFDITSRDPADVYTDPRLFVACNWSGEPGKTGASAAGASLDVCGGFGKPLFSAMPELKKDHEYLLLISHFTDSQSGYSLEFSGTANITDPKTPRLQSARANCEGSEITVALNKKMKCASLAADGSDFRLNTSLVAITGASSRACSGSFNMDTVTLTLSGALPPGDYILSVKNGADGNTLFDNCGVNIAENDQVDLVILPVTPTPMDSLTAPSCLANALQLVFKKPIRCSSIAGNGSDFFVSGPVPVAITGAYGACSADGKSSMVTVTLAAPLSVKGDYQLQLKQGTDGNTLIDECGQESPPSAISFFMQAAVSADFQYDITPGCRTDTIRLTHDGANDVNQWVWILPDIPSQFAQNTTRIFTSTGQKKISLRVSNGFCSDTADIVLDLLPKVKSLFDAPDIICGADKTAFTDRSVGDIASWQWDFGNSGVSDQPSPRDISYPRMPGEKKYTVRLAVTGTDGCKDTSTKAVTVVGNCYIAVPSAFTPNNDGLNDYLFPSNAYKADNLLFRVYNRFGQMVHQTRDWTQKWNGELNGRPQPAGTYVWTLSYTDRDSGKTFFLKGATVLIR